MRNNYGGSSLEEVTRQESCTVTAASSHRATDKGDREQASVRAWCDFTWQHVLFVTSLIP